MPITLANHVDEPPQNLRKVISSVSEMQGRVKCYSWPKYINGGTNLSVEYLIEMVDPASMYFENTRHDMLSAGCIPRDDP